MENIKNILLCVSGASGAIYANNFINNTIKLKNYRLYIIFTQTAKDVWEHEIGEEYSILKDRLTKKYKNVEFIENNNFKHKFASGSNMLYSMVILPCSMGTLARISSGISSDLICRIADVQLKERRNIVVAPRETPYNLIHLKNMLALTEAGAIIAPVSPSFYTKPSNIKELTNTFCERIMNLAHIKDLSENNKWQ